MTRRLEIHEHSLIGGPNYRPGARQKVRHSHEGPLYHEHEHYGPPSYTVDKDDWYQATGLRGGGRKKFTVRPTGPQMPYTEPA